MINGRGLRLGLLLIVSLHIVLANQPVDTSVQSWHFQRESQHLDDFVDELDVANGPLCLQGLDDSSIDEELAVSKYALLYVLTILLRLLLLD